MTDDPHSRRFDEFLATQRGRLVAIARVYAGKDADDLLQEILLQVWKSISGFDGRSSLATWGYRVAINTSLQWRRSAGRKRKAIPPEAFDVANVQDQRGNVDARQLLNQFLESLGDADRAVLLMYMDDLSNTEMSEVLGISEGALRVRLHRIKEKLRDWNGGES